MDKKERDEAIVKAYVEEGLSPNKISKNYGMTRSGICHILERYNVDIRKRYVLEQEISNGIVLDYQKGVHSTIIALKYRVGTSTIFRILRKKGIAIRTKAEVKKFHNLDENAFDSPLTEAARYYAGFLMADGCVTGKNTICVCLAITDRGLIESFRNFLKSTHVIHESYSRIRPGDLVQKRQKTVYFTFNSTKIFNRLNEIGIKPRKSLSCKVLDAELEKCPHFWRGVVDGDGCLTFYNRKNDVPYPQLQLVGSCELLLQFRNFCKNIAPLSQAKVRPKGTIFCIAYSGRYAKQIITYLYSHATVFLNRKLSAAKKIINDI